MANSADPDQLASSEANCSGSTLFAKAGHVQLQWRQIKSIKVVLENTEHIRGQKSKSRFHWDSSYDNDVDSKPCTVELQ